MKPTTKKSNALKGPSFADAMFGIKDITMQYGDLQGGDFQIPVPKMNTKPNPNTKMTVVKKQPIPVKKQQKSPPLNSKIQLTTQKKGDTFKLSSGKQFDNFTTTALVPIQTTQDVYQLTLNGKQSNWQYNIFCDGIQAKMIVPEPQVSFNFQAMDVKQGGLGNCYFISTLASLAHLPKILRQRIPKFKSYSGKDKSYQVNLFESGKNIKIIVDNLFPKVFAKPVGNDISLMILQKAYAQAYGNFDIINMGHSCDSLRDMTGAPTQYVDLKDRVALIVKIQQIFKQKYPIIIASKVNLKTNYLSPKHSYNIIDYKIKQGNLLLKLRDPRGCNCMHFPNIHPISQEDSSNGMFWIDYKTLVDNFQVITISKAKQGYKYFFKTFKTKQLSNNSATMIVRVKQKGNFTFSCNQKHKKFFDEKFSYQLLRILLAKINYKNSKITPVQTIGSDFKTQQVCSVTADLDEGQYILFTKIGNNKAPKLESQALTVSVYTSIMKPQSVQFDILKGNLPIQPFISSYISEHKQQFKESISDQKLYRYFGAIYGYLSIYYENRGSKSVIEELNYNTQNITITDTKISLSPGQSKVIMHPIGEQNNCSHKFAFKTKTIYK